MQNRKTVHIKRGFVGQTSFSEQTKTSKNLRVEQASDAITVLHSFDIK